MISKDGSQRIQLFSPPVEFLHHNFITHLVFSITKNKIVKTILHSISLPLPVKTLPQGKFPAPLKCPVSQLLLTLFGWLHVMNRFLQFNKLQNPQQKSCGSSIKVVLLFFLSKV